DKLDRLVCFDAFISNFDTQDHKDADGKIRHYGIAHWVSQRVDAADKAPESRSRPSEWFSVPDLQKAGLAPTDDSYHFSAEFLDGHPNWYERGQLAAKYLAERRGRKIEDHRTAPAWFTHNVVNAVPQRRRFYAGAWQTLECYTGAWANKYKTVWIVSGPIFSRGQPGADGWLRSTRHKAMEVAVPDQLFKIVVRKEDYGWGALAFVYPQDDPSYGKGPWNPADRLASIAQDQPGAHQNLFRSLARKPPGEGPA